MIDEQSRALKELSGAQFAAYEAQLFLDTHPNDGEALRAFKKYRQEYMKLLEEYEKKYGEVTAGSNFGMYTFEWINDPWPWEKEAN